MLALFSLDSEGVLMTVREFLISCMSLCARAKKMLFLALKGSQETEVYNKTGHMTKFE